MASIILPQINPSPQLRPLNIVRDLTGVADLVEKCFADTMDMDGRNYLQQMRRAGQDNAFLRWASRAVETASMPLSGYIWEENGEIIGNVSLIPYNHCHRKYYLIANVAVRPDFRKRGIGHALTFTAMQHAKQRHADETWLHVRDDNPGAIDLYRSLGFVELARRTGWQAPPDRNSGKVVQVPGQSGANTRIVMTRRAARDWIYQETWLHQLYPDILSWYQPVPWNSMRPGFVHLLYRFLSDTEVRHWVARVNNQPAAVISWQPMAERSNRLWVALPMECNGDILTSLLQHSRRQLFWRENINLDFPAGEYHASFEAAGFHKQRTLLWMKWDETLLEDKRKSIRIDQSIPDN